MLWRRTVLWTAFTLGATLAPVASEAKEIVVQVAPPALRVEVVGLRGVGFNRVGIAEVEVPGVARLGDEVGPL